MKCVCSDVMLKMYDYYICKVSEIIVEVLKIVVLQLVLELWEVVRRKDEVSKIFEFVYFGSDLLLVVVEFYKEVDFFEIRC